MDEHQGNTNEITKVKLPSSIESVAWTSRVVAVTGTASLEVFTRYIGNGAELQIELSDHSGKKHGSFKEKIAGNYFWASVKVPEDAKNALYAEVNFSNHGLKLKSPPLLLTPPVEIKNLKWSAKEARRGDALKLTADVKGVPDGSDAEITIWEHDADGAHDLITQFPALVEGNKITAEWEYEYHEDTDDIPTEEETEKGYNPPEYFFRVNVGGVSGDSGLLTFKDWFEITLVDDSGQPIPDEEYILTFADGKERKGKLNAEGKAMEKDVPPGIIDVIFPRIEERDESE